MSDELYFFKDWKFYESNKLSLLSPVDDRYYKGWIKYLDIIIKRVIGMNVINIGINE